MCKYAVMAIAHSRLTAQGQISVPSEVRKKLGLTPGSILEWDENGEHIVVRRAGQFTSEDVHNTIFAQPPKARNLSDMKSGMRRHVQKKHARR